MAESNITQFHDLANAADADGPSPRMVTLFRGSKEIAAVGASDAEDAAKQVAILVLKQTDGLKVGDVIQITRI